MAFLWFFMRVGEPDRLKNYILEGPAYDEIVRARRECDGELLKGILFGGESLFYDRMSHTFYYSVVEGDEFGYDPVVTLKIKGGGWNKILSPGGRDYRRIDLCRTQNYLYGI